MSHFAQFCKRVSLLLLGLKKFGKVGDESTGKRDVTDFNFDVGCLSKALTIGRNE